MNEKNRHWIFAACWIGWGVVVCSAKHFYGVPGWSLFLASAIVGAIAGLSPSALPRDHYAPICGRCKQAMKSHGKSGFWFCGNCDRRDDCIEKTEQ